MSRHAAVGRPRRGRVGALAATLGVVGVFGLVIAIVAGLRAADAGSADPVAGDTANVAAHLPGRATGGTRPRAPRPAGPHGDVGTAPEPQRVVTAQPLKLDPVEGHARARRAAGAVKQARREAARPKTSAFRIGTLNILGSQHTAGQGRLRPRPASARASAPDSSAPAASTWSGSRRSRTTRSGRCRTGSATTACGRSRRLGNNGQRLQVMWRESKFELVDTGSVPYVFASQSHPAPVGAAAGPRERRASSTSSPPTTRRVAWRASGTPRPRSRSR